MTSKLRDYINETMNDNRIFSYEDVIAMDNEEGRYYQKAWVYGKILIFPVNSGERFQTGLCAIPHTALFSHT